MDWIHCNQCYIQPGDVEIKKFFITNCGHIYCGECLRMNSSKDCRICRVKFNTMPLTPQISPEVEVYFHDPVVNLQKQLKILEFQHSHRIRLVSHNRERISAYKNLKKENYTLCEELKLYKQENMTLRGEIKRIREEFVDFKKKIEPLGHASQQHTHTTPTHSFSQYITKTSQKAPYNVIQKNIYGCDILNENSQPLVKRSSNSNFFLMSETKLPSKNDEVFTTPDLPRFPGSHRSIKTSTPELATPSTPDLHSREHSQKDPLQRKVKLPGSRSGPSPATKLGIHRLILSRPTMTPNKENTVANKYLKYFK